MEPSAATSEAAAAEAPEMRCSKAPGLLKIIAALETPVLHMTLSVQFGFIGTSAGTCGPVATFVALKDIPLSVRHHP